MKAILAVLFCCVLTVSAQAKPHHYQHYTQRTHAVRLAGHSSTPEYVTEDRFGVGAGSGTAGYGSYYQASTGYERGYSVASSGGLSGPCREAARLGGPCGCHTAETLLGTSAHVYHGINVWLANGWLAFQRVAPAPGTAAVWPGRHVAPVVAVNGDGTVTVEDYFGTRTVRMAGLIFVDPRSR